MPVYTGDQSTAVDLTGVESINGFIDAGSANINKKVAFSITNLTPLMDPESGGDGNAYVTMDSTLGDGDPPDGLWRVNNGNDQGIDLSADDDGVSEDDFSWAGAITASTAVNPTITLNLVMAPTQSPKSHHLGIGIGVGL